MSGAGLGIGTPGPLIPSQGVVIKAANLPAWQNVPLRTGMAERTGMAVHIDNDGNVAALAEARAGGDRDLVMLTLGTGIGGGVVVDGRILHGHFENAGEVGHMIVVPEGRPCTCGQRGCLEAYASARCVVERVVEALEAGERSELAGIDHPLGAEDVAAAVDRGDALASRIWDDACRSLAIACINLQHLLNPARIVLGGGLARSEEALLGPVRAHAGRLKWTLMEDMPEVSAARLGYDAGAIGAALLALGGSA